MKQLYTAFPVTVAGITLILIEQIQIHSEKRLHACWLSTTKEAIAVVICDLSNPRALNIEAGEVAIDELLTSVPELESLLAEFYQ